MVTRYEDYLRQGYDPLEDEAQSFDDSAASAIPPPPSSIEPPNVGPEGDVVLPDLSYDQPAPPPAPTGREYFGYGGDHQFQEENSQLPGDYGKSFLTNEDYVAEQGLLGYEDVLGGPPSLPFDQAELEHGFFTNTEQQLAWWESEIDKAIQSGDAVKLQQLISEIERYQGISNDLNSYLESPEYRTYLDSVDFWNVVPENERESPDLLASIVREPSDQLMTFANPDRSLLYPETSPDMSQTTFRHDQRTVDMAQERATERYQEAVRRNRDAAKYNQQGFLTDYQVDPVARISALIGPELDGIIAKAGSLTSPNQIIPFARQLADLPVQDQATLLQLAVDRVAPQDPLARKQWINGEGLRLAYVANEAAKAADVGRLLKNLPPDTTLYRIMNAWRPQTYEEYQADWTDYLKVANSHIFGGTGIDRLMEHTVPFAANLTGLTVKNINFLAPYVGRAGKSAWGGINDLWNLLPDEGKLLFEGAWWLVEKPAAASGESAYTNVAALRLNKIIPELLATIPYYGTWLPAKAFQKLTGADRMILPESWGSVNIGSDDLFQLATAGVYQAGYGWVRSSDTVKKYDTLVEVNPHGTDQFSNFRYDAQFHEERYRQKYRNSIGAQLLFETLLDPIDYVLAPVGHAITIGKARHLRGVIEPSIKLHHPEAHGAMLRYFSHVGGAPTVRDMFMLQRRVTTFSNKYLPGMEDFFKKNGIDLIDYPELEQAIRDFHLAVYFQLHREFGPGGAVKRLPEIQSVVARSHDAFLLRVEQIGITIEKIHGTYVPTDLVKSEGFRKTEADLIAEAIEEADKIAEDPETFNYAFPEEWDYGDPNIGAAENSAIDQMLDALAEVRDQQVDTTVGVVPYKVTRIPQMAADEPGSLVFEHPGVLGPAGRPLVITMDQPTPGLTEPPIVNIPDPATRAQLEVLIEIDDATGMGIVDQFTAANNGEPPTATQAVQAVQQLDLGIMPQQLDPDTGQPVMREITPVEAFTQLGLPGNPGGPIQTKMALGEISRQVDRIAGMGRGIERFTVPELEAIARTITDDWQGLWRDLETLFPDPHDGLGELFNKLFFINLGLGEDQFQQLATKINVGMSREDLHNILTTVLAGSPSTPVLNDLIRTMTGLRFLDPEAVARAQNILEAERLIFEAMRTGDLPLNPSVLSREGIVATAKQGLRAKNTSRRIGQLLPRYVPEARTLTPAVTGRDLRGLKYQLMQHGQTLQSSPVYGPILSDLMDAVVGENGEIFADTHHLIEDLTDPRMAASASETDNATLYEILINWHAAGGSMDGFSDDVVQKLAPLVDDAALVRQSEREIGALREEVEIVESHIADTAARLRVESRPWRLLNDADLRFVDRSRTDLPESGPLPRSSALRKLHDAMEALDEPVRRFADFARKEMKDVDDPHVDEWIRQISVIFRQYKRDAGLGRVSHQEALRHWMTSSQQLDRTRRQLQSHQSRQRQLMAEMNTVDKTYRDMIVMQSKQRRIQALAEWSRKNIGMEIADETDPGGIAMITRDIQTPGSLRNVGPAKWDQMQREARARIQRTSTASVIAAHALDREIRLDPVLPPVANAGLFPRKENLQIQVRAPEDGAIPDEAFTALKGMIEAELPAGATVHISSRNKKLSEVFAPHATVNHPSARLHRTQDRKKMTGKDWAQAFERGAREVVGDDAVLFVVRDPVNPYFSDRDAARAMGKYQKVIEYDPRTGQVRETFPHTDELRRRQKLPETVEAAVNKMPKQMRELRKGKDIGYTTPRGREMAPLPWTRFDNLMSWLKPSGAEAAGVMQPIQVVDRLEDGSKYVRAIHSAPGFDVLTTRGADLNRMGWTVGAERRGEEGPGVLSGEALKRQQRQLSKQLRDAGFYELVDGKDLIKKYPVYEKTLDPRQKYMVSTKLAADYWTWQQSKFGWIDDPWGRQDWSRKAITDRTEMIARGNSKALQGITDPDERRAAAEKIATEYIRLTEELQDQAHWMADMSMGQFVGIIAGEVRKTDSENRIAEGEKLFSKIKRIPSRESGFAIFDYDMAFDAIDEVIEFIDDPILKGKLANWRKLFEDAYQEGRFDAEIVNNMWELARFLDENYDMPIYSISESARRMVFDDGPSFSAGDAVDPDAVPDPKLSFRNPRMTSPVEEGGPYPRDQRPIDYKKVDERTRLKMQERSQLAGPLREREMQLTREVEPLMTELNKLDEQGLLHLDGMAIWFHPKDAPLSLLDEWLKKGYIKPAKVDGSRVVLTELAKERLFIHGYSGSDISDFVKIMSDDTITDIDQLRAGDLNRFIRAGLIAPTVQKTVDKDSLGLAAKKGKIRFTRYGLEVLETARSEAFDATKETFPHITRGKPRALRGQESLWTHAARVLENTRRAYAAGEDTRFRGSDFNSISERVIRKIVHSWWDQQKLYSVDPAFARLNQMKVPRFARKLLLQHQPNLPDGWRQVLKQDDLLHAWSTQMSTYYDNMIKDRKILADRMGYDSEFLSQSSQMQRVGEVVGFHLKTMLDDLAHRRPDQYGQDDVSLYEDARRLVLGISRGKTSVKLTNGSRVNPFAWFETYFSEDEHGRMTLRAYQELGEEVVKRWNSLTPHPSLQDLHHIAVDKDRTLWDIVPRPKSGIYGAEELLEWNKFFTNDDYYFGLTKKDLKSHNRTLQNTMDMMRETLKLRWITHARPNLYRHPTLPFDDEVPVKVPKISDELHDALSYEMMEQVFGGADADDLSKLGYIRSKVGKDFPEILKMDDDTFEAFYRTHILGERVTRTIKAGTYATDSSGSFLEPEWQMVDAEELDALIFPEDADSPLDIDGLIANLETEFSKQYGISKKFIDNTGRPFDPSVLQRADASLLSLQAGVKRWMTPLWMTMVPRYHVNNFMSNVASIMLMMSRGDNFVRPGVHGWVRELAERPGSGFVMPEWVTDGFTQQREGFSDIRKIQDHVAGWESFPAYARLVTVKGRRVNPVGWATMAGVTVGDIVERSAKTWLFQAEWAGTYSKVWKEAVERVFAMETLLDAAGNMPQRATNLTSMGARRTPAGSMAQFKAQLLGARGIDEVRTILNNNASHYINAGMYGKFVEDLMEGQRSAILTATNRAYTSTAHALRDYRMRNKVDVFLDRIIPIHYWTTKNWLMVGATIKDKPWRLAQGMRAYDTWAESWEDEPTAAKNKVRLFEAPEDSGPWSKAKLWLRPNQWINPAFFAAPAALQGMKKDWNRYENAGLTDRIWQFSKSGMRNLWEVMGYRIGPQYELAIGHGFTIGSDKLAEKLGLENRFLDSFNKGIRHVAFGDGYYHPSITPLGSYEGMIKTNDTVALVMENINQKVYGSRYSRGELTAYGFQLAEMYRAGEFGEPGSDDAWMGLLEAMENLHQYSQGDVSEPLPIVREAVSQRNGDRSVNAIVSHMGFPITPITDAYQQSWLAADDFYSLYADSQKIQLLGNPSSEHKKIAADLNREIEAVQKKRDSDIEKGRDVVEVEEEFNAKLADIYAKVPRELPVGNVGDTDAAWDFLRDEHPEILAIWLANDNLNQVQDAIDYASHRDTVAKAAAAVDAYWDGIKVANAGTAPFYDRLRNLDEEYDKQVSQAEGNRYLIEAAKRWYEANKSSIIEEMLDAGLTFNPTGNLPQHGQAYYDWRYGVTPAHELGIVPDTGSYGMVDTNDRRLYVQQLVDNDAVGAVDRYQRQLSQKDYFAEMSFDLLGLSMFVDGEFNPRFVDDEGEFDNERWLKEIRKAAPAAVEMFDGLKANFRAKGNIAAIEAEDPNNYGRIPLSRMIVDTGGGLTESEWIEKFVAQEEQAAEWYKGRREARDLYNDMGFDEIVTFNGEKMTRDQLGDLILRTYGPDALARSQSKELNPNTKLALSQDDKGQLILKDVTDDLVEGGEAWVIGEGRRAVSNFYWNDLSYGGRKDFREQYPEAFTFNKDEDRYDFDITKLSGEQIREIRDKNNIPLPGRVTPREGPGGRPAPRRSNAAHQATQINNIYESYWNQEYLTPAQVENSAEWDLYLTLDPEMEQFVQDERKKYSTEDSEISWSNLATIMSLRSNQDAADYIWARQKKWDDLGMSEILSAGEDFLRGPEGKVLREDDPEWEDKLTKNYTPPDIRRLEAYMESGVFLEPDALGRHRAWTSFTNATETKNALGIGRHYKDQYSTPDDPVSWKEVPDLLRRHGHDDEALIVEKRNRLFTELDVPGIYQQTALWLTSTEEGQKLFNFKSTTDYSYDWYLDFLDDGGGGSNRRSGNYSGASSGYGGYRTAGSVSRSSTNYPGQNQSDPQKVGAVMGVLRVSDPALVDPSHPEHGLRLSYAKAASDAAGLLLSLFAMMPNGSGRSLSAMLTYHITQKIGKSPTIDHWRRFLEWLDIDPDSIQIMSTPPGPEAAMLPPVAPPPAGEIVPQEPVSRLPEIPGYAPPGGFNV